MCQFTSLLTEHFDLVDYMQMIHLLRTSGTNLDIQLNDMNNKLHTVY